MLKYTGNFCRHTRVCLLVQRRILFHSSTVFQKQPPPSDLEDFQMFYRFPHMQLARTICRLKLYQSALAVGAAPVMGYLHNIGYVTQTDVMVSFLGSVIALAMLTVFGEFSRRLVGIMYLDKNGENVRVAHLTFTGKRKDVLIPVNDIVPLSELPDRIDDAYVKMQTYSSAHQFYFTVRLGHVMDRAAFTKVFGPIPHAK